MTPWLVTAAAALLLSGPASGEEILRTPTGRILMATPRPASAPSVIETRLSEDPWPYQGDLFGVRLLGTMWSVSGGAAVLEDSAGQAYVVHVGSRLGEQGARVVAITAGRIELIEETGSPVLDHAWCRLVLERVEQRVMLPAAKEGDPPTYTTRAVTRLTKDTCARHEEDLLM